MLRVYKLHKLFLLIFIIVYAMGQNVDLSLDFKMDTSLFHHSDELKDIIQSKIVTQNNILGLIIIQNGKIISESYYNGSSKDSINNIYSVTKSFMSTLIGQAIDMDIMFSVDSSFSKFIPENNIDYSDRITLHNMLSLTSGFKNHYEYPGYINQPTDSLVSVGFTVPDKFLYSNSSSHLNAHALFHTTKMTPYQFASKYLFPYLGIDNPRWDYGYLNINDGATNLYLNLRDMVKLGQLYIQKGYSNSNNILPNDWIHNATSVQVSTAYEDDPSYSHIYKIIAKLVRFYLPPGYGYLWWIPDIHDSYLAMGYGGQFILVVPKYNLVIGTQSSLADKFYLNMLQSNRLLKTILYDVVPLFSNKQ